MGAMAATSVLSNVAKLTAYTDSGILDGTQQWTMTGLVLAAVVAVLIGQRILRNVKASYFESGIQVVLAVSAFALLM